MKRTFILLILCNISLIQYGQIIADHRVVDLYDDIPQQWIDAVKKMWVSIPGESHSLGYRTGLNLLEVLDPAYDVNVKESGTPEAYTTNHLRASKATRDDWGGWSYSCGEDGWWTNSAAITGIENSITYCNTNNLEVAAIGFGWCWDAIAGSPTTNVDPVYGVHWYGWSQGSPTGDSSWGLESNDYAQTSNSVSLDTYLAATQAYVDYCNAKGYNTKVFFTTGPVDTYYYGEAGYQGHLKYERIRDYVKANSTRILFDYADILSYDDNGSTSATTWNGHTYPNITNTNLSPTVDAMHISNAGALRLGKAMWWMLARIAGWDGGMIIPTET